MRQMTPPATRATTFPVSMGRLRPVLAMKSPRPPWYKICITNTSYLVINEPCSKSYQSYTIIIRDQIGKKGKRPSYIEVYINKVEAQIGRKKESNLHKWKRESTSRWENTRRHQALQNSPCLWSLSSFFLSNFTITKEKSVLLQPQDPKKSISPPWQWSSPRWDWATQERRWKRRGRRWTGRST